MPDRFAIVIPAAGTSTRFAGPRNKLDEDLLGHPVWRRAVQAFLDRTDVGTIIVVGHDDPLNDPRVQFTPGGATRAHSVWNGLRAVPDDYQWVAVHDAARPLVSQELITRVFEAARHHGAAVPALPVHLTVRRAHGPLPAKSQGVVDRHELWAMQTPQAARRHDLLAAFEQAEREGALSTITDDVQPLERQAHEVWIVPGEERNLKITTRQDLALAEWWLRQSPSTTIEQPNS